MIDRRDQKRYQISSTDNIQVFSGPLIMTCPPERGFNSGVEETKNLKQVQKTGHKQLCSMEEGHKRPTSDYCRTISPSESTAKQPWLIQRVYSGLDSTNFENEGYQIYYEFQNTCFRLEYVKK